MAPSSEYQTIRQRKNKPATMGEAVAQAIPPVQPEFSFAAAAWGVNFYAGTVGTPLVLYSHYLNSCDPSTKLPEYRLRISCVPFMNTTMRRHYAIA